MIACHPNNEIEIFCLYLFNNDGGLGENWGMEEIQLVINTKHKVVFLVHSEARQYLNVVVWRAEKGLLQNHTGRWVTCAPENPKLPKHFRRWGEERTWLAAADFLVLESFVLGAVHMGQVMMFL